MSAEREIAAEDSIRVVCRFRPLNDSEEKAGSKVIVKFPNSQEENCLSIGVSTEHANGKSLCKMHYNGTLYDHANATPMFALNVYSGVSLVFDSWFFLLFLVRFVFAFSILIYIFLPI